MVRGLDYYTKTVFEFVTTALGSQGTVCGGGRYNNLVESVGGKPTPCVGFGLGLERLIMLLDSLGVEIENNDRPELFVLYQNADYVSYCMDIVRSLRLKGISTETELTGRSLKAQMKYADKIGAKNVMIIGEQEINSRKANLKCMLNSTQEEVSLDDIGNLADKAFEVYLFDEEDAE